MGILNEFDKQDKQKEEFQIPKYSPYVHEKELTSEKIIEEYLLEETKRKLTSCNEEKDEEEDNAILGNVYHKYFMAVLNDPNYYKDNYNFNKTPVKRIEKIKLFELEKQQNFDERLREDQNKVKIEQQEQDKLLKQKEEQLRVIQELQEQRLQEQEKQQKLLKKQLLQELLQKLQEQKKIPLFHHEKQQEHQEEKLQKLLETFLQNHPESPEEWEQL
jgi:hypothetical protein